ncbi:GntR family transcriptional regulator [Lacticaseibacillus pantheris]|uniref:GntR family transcriptional regulator n=1 Tax=Lacticaseibacillus pantheris TaxID=171523 RepID=UPI002659A3D1|nr:GntR family transcriptional regulator [Lacticaseibacillus pantheris]WKF85231.1 GntR family transcriptional regulator [Lacticaseibacillus pantheris]
MNGTPKYKIVANAIRQQIIYGEFEIDDQIPQELVLSKKYNVSRITVRKALDELENEGLIYRIQGSGTFVKSLSRSNKPNKEKNIDILPDIFDIKDARITVLKPDDDVSQELRLPVSNFVYCINRVLTLDDTPVVYQTIYIPLQHVQGISVDPKKFSISNFLSEDAGLDIVAVQRSFGVTYADDTVSKSLETTLNQPLLLVKQTASTANSTIILLSLNYILTQKYALTAELFLE